MLAGGGDLIIDQKLTVANRHDLLTVACRRTPAIVVLGARNPAHRSTEKCDQRVNCLGRFMICDGSTVASTA